jgi:site-specific recombinase XerD
MTNTEIVEHDRNALQSSPDITDLVNTWLEDIDKKADTTRTYRKALEDFTDWYNTEQRPALDTPDKRAAAGIVRDFKYFLNEDEGYSAATVNLKLSALRSFFSWTVREGLIEKNPAEDVDGMKRAGTSKRHKRDELTTSEVRRVLEGCQTDESLTGTRDAALIALMAYTGLRTVEVHRANIEDLKTEDDRTILEVQGKGSDEKGDIVVLPEDAENILSDWLSERSDAIDEDPLFVSLSPRNRGDRLSRHAIRTMVKRRLKDAGIVNGRKSTHSLRHSAISNAIRNGADPEQAQAMARHENMNTTMTYYHEINRVENAAEDLIDYGEAE